LFIFSSAEEASWSTISIISASVLNTIVNCWMLNCKIQYILVHSTVWFDVRKSNLILYTESEMYNKNKHGHSWNENISYFPLTVGKLNNYSFVSPFSLSLSLSLYLSLSGSTALSWTFAAFSVFWSHTQSVGLLGRKISLSQGRYLHTEQHRHRINAHTDIYALIVIRTHDPSVRASEDNSCLRLRGHCDRLCRLLTNNNYICNAEEIHIQIRWWPNIKWSE
jgi:hypothetical protein